MIIYEIVCNITGERYIGSTKQKLNKRMTSHRDKKRKCKCSSKQIINRGDYQVNILEEGDFNKDEREQYYMDSLPNINQRRAYGHDTERYKKYWVERDKTPERKLQKKLMSARRWKWRKEWGGSPHTENNLLLISADLFQ